ncbi:hypothetical protein GEMRC1_001671 [Eukaryota sp. GEM-RC1]
MDRDPSILPTRFNLQQLSIQLKSAVDGHSLLKRKSDALLAHNHKVTRQIAKVQQAVDKSVKDALLVSHKLFGFQDLIYHTYLNNVRHMPLLKLLPVLELRKERSTDLDLTGLAKGGEAISQCRTMFISAIDQIVKLASLQTAIQSLKEIILKTNRRVNAIEHFIIPKLEATEKWISAELEEQEREEFFRMRMVQKNNKKRQKESLVIKDVDFVSPSDVDLLKAGLDDDTIIII